MYQGALYLTALRCMRQRLIIDFSWLEWAPNLNFKSWLDKLPKDQTVSSLSTKHENVREVELLLTDPTVNKPKLSAIFDRLSGSNDKLSKLIDEL